MSKDNGKDNGTYPFTLEVLPCERPAGHFQWAIRKHGKRVERSDRVHPSERSARDQGQSALERQLREDREPKRTRLAAWRQVMATCDRLSHLDCLRPGLTPCAVSI